MTEWTELWPAILVGVVIGLAIGLLIGLLMGQARSRKLEIDRAKEAARSEERLRAQVELSDQQEAVFRSAASEALQANSDQFLKLANQRLTQARTEATSDLEARKTAIAHLVAPMKETLDRLTAQTVDLERQRSQAYGKLEQHLGLLATQTQDLNQSTASLSTALRGSTAGGRWGEIALRNLVELAGMNEHVDFQDQGSLEGGGRPDLIITMPGDRFIAVDAKAPTSAYLDVLETTDANTVKQRRTSLAKVIRSHVQQLSSREYAEQLEGEVDYVVLFLPTDAILSEAFKGDRDLQVDAFRRKILVATPTILVALLRTVAFDWQRNALERNAQEIGDLATTLIDRTATYANNLGELGAQLDKAVSFYNRAANSFRTRIRPLRQQLAELSGSEDSERKDPEEITQRVADPEIDFDS